MDENQIRENFKIACAKIDELAVHVDSLDTYLSELVSYIRRFPDHKPVFSNLLVSGLHGSHIPDEVMEYCFHALKWEELKVSLENCRDEWLSKPSKKFYWEQLMNTFSDDWKDIDIYPSLQG